MTTRPAPDGGMETLRRLSAAVDRALRAFIDRQSPADFYDLMRYHLSPTAGGGAPIRSRAILSLLACQACGGTVEAAMPLAMAVTLMHNFSRIQEDIERQRSVSNGRASVFGKWGLAQAMNAGDGMHALAKAALIEGRGSQPAGTILHLEEALDECCLAMCEVTHNELAAEGAAGETAAAVRKSAVQFEYAAYAGCFLGGGGADRQRAMRRLGRSFGALSACGETAPDRAPHLYQDVLDRLQPLALDAAVAEALRHLALHLASR